MTIAPLRVSPLVRSRVLGSQLVHAYRLLERLCQQYVQDALQSVRQASVPLWHHKLLYAWCAKQATVLASAGSANEGVDAGDDGRHIAPSEVVAAHANLWAEVQLAEKCGPCLGDALIGKVAYQELLFPGGSMEVMSKRNSGFAL